MVDIRAFVHDSYQEKLRNLAQVQSETYEEALEKYRDSFITELILIKESKVEIADNLNRKKYDSIFNYIKEIDIGKLHDFFDKVISIYIEWIDSKGQEALNKFEELLEEINFKEFKYDLSNSILFRGRISDTILTPWDMFHIPFNKRYLIGNQRYSLTGQPLVYLGFSILDILAELDKGFDEFNDVKLCTYKLKENFRVFDLRNEFYRYLRYDPLDDLIIDSDYVEEISYNEIKNKFLKFILASICSFEKRQEHRRFSFCEEYVLPQMLAQIIKKNRFNGIIYCSTKLKNERNDKLYNSTYKENVAIFTNFGRQHVYDNTLYSKFKISNPISSSQIKEIPIGELKKICDTIKILDSFEEYKDYYLIGEKLDDDFSKILINDNIYFEHKIGKVHIYLVYNMLIDIRNECIRKRRESHGTNN